MATRRTTKTAARAKRRATKDRVLQARIPEQLDDELRDRAEQLGLSVSTIVRNALSHTFDLVEGVVSDSAQIGRVLQGLGDTSAAGTRLHPFEGGAGGGRMAGSDPESKRRLRHLQYHIAQG